MTSRDDDESLNRRPGLPKLQLMPARVLVVFVLAVVGICLGVAGAIFSLTLLTIAAGLVAVVACFVLGYSTLLPLLQKSEQDNLEHRINSVTRSSDNENVGLPDGSVIDDVTELPDGRFFEVAVEGRVAAARRHLWPVSVVLLQIGFDEDGNKVVEARNRSLQSFANLMRQTLREADVACRIDETTFGLILEDTSEEGGVWTAERLQIALSHDVTNIQRLVAGVAAYPTHGLFSKDVMVRAQAALNRASSTPAGHGLGQVEVAHVDL